jgi:hypothetical protein
MIFDRGQLLAEKTTLQTFAAHHGDHLTTPCVLRPTRTFEHGMASEYEIALPNDAVAVVRLVAAKGWNLIVRERNSDREISRGLFATPHDALMVMAAEVRNAH